MSERSTGLPSQQQVIELLDGEFARAGYDIEDVVIESSARPPRITVVADSDHGLDLQTVAELSRTASELLDTVESAAYVLEVSSPGVDRPLTTEKHYRRAQGRLAELTLTDGSVLTAVSDGGPTTAVYDCEVPSGACEEIGRLEGSDALFLGAQG